MSLIVPGFDESVIVRSADADGDRPSADHHPAAGRQQLDRRRVVDPTGQPDRRRGWRQAAPPRQLGRAVLPARRHRPTAVRRAGRDRRARRLVVVPPGLAHAFAAAPGEDADILIVNTSGVERFEYFRHLERIAYGKVPPENLLEVQELYDTYFVTSKTWNNARS